MYWEQRTSELIEMCHLMQKSVSSRFEEFEGLVRLTPAVLCSTRITGEFLVLEEFLRARRGEEFWAESDDGGEDVAQFFGICNGQRFLAFLGLFAGDDEVELKFVSPVATGAGLNATEHLIYLS